jgi:hypothetical protein
VGKMGLSWGLFAFIKPPDTPQRDSNSPALLILGELS